MTHRRKSNLALVNSFIALEQGGLPPGAEVERLGLARDESGVVLTVADDGIGTSWPPPKQGLGTMIIESPVARIGGTLSCSGEGGSAWAIRLPL